MSVSLEVTLTEGHEQGQETAQRKLACQLSALWKLSGALSFAVLQLWRTQEKQASVADTAIGDGLQTPTGEGPSSVSQSPAQQAFSYTGPPEKAHSSRPLEKSPNLSYLFSHMTCTNQRLHFGLLSGRTVGEGDRSSRDTPQFKTL